MHFIETLNWMEAEMQFSTQFYEHLMGQPFVIKIVAVSKIPYLTHMHAWVRAQQARPLIYSKIICTSLQNTGNEQFQKCF
jgi:hypothetical protein